MITYPQNPFVRTLWISLAAHVLVVLLIYIVPKIFPTFTPTRKVLWVQLPPGIAYDTEQIRKAENLPRSTIQEQLEALKKHQDSDKEVPSQEPEKPQKVPEKELEKPTLVQEKPAPPKPAKKQPSALDRKIAAALTKNKKAVETKKEVPIEAAQVPEGASGAGSLSSNQGGPVDPAYAQYYTLIKERINREWITIPKLFDSSQDLRTEMVVMISADGTVTEISIDQASGNESFDLSAKQAIERASPLPTPPPGLQEEILDEGFLIEFSPMKVER